ncbi:hypothetical protein [Salimicrobium halophilum]|uniref:Uncharacterized protein n=1 Tax=Salimicrobium halophilum TaxID=86666 RepID=A0A1G8WE74_9BACI|nr:hypothetical protein [Salimicrobium halophilum]SDJ76582.1 hypothetical protein SAMN04490247_3150 [Salimicrobium halophilum]
MIDIDKWHDDYVWTLKDVKEAAENGISYKNFYQRVEVYGWTVKKAKTHHVMSRQERCQKYDQKWRDLCEANGIPWQLFISRRVMGWSKEKAATAPHAHDNPVIPKYYRDKARKNGLAYHVIYHRIRNLNWDPEVAVTKPKASRKEAAIEREQKKREKAVHG